MFSAFQTFGKLGALASSVARAWSPRAYVAAIGDSIVRNNYTPESSGGNVGYKRRWTGFGAWLPMAAWKTAGAVVPDIYAMEGYSGQRSDQILTSLQSASATESWGPSGTTFVGIAARPMNIVVDCSGTNDLTYYEALSDAAGATKTAAGRLALWNKIRESGAIPVALSLMPRSSPALYADKVASYNSAIKAVADANGVPWVDVYTPCDNGSGAWKTGYTYHNGANDSLGLHPSFLASQQIAAALAPVLSSLVSSRRKLPRILVGKHAEYAAVQFVAGGKGDYYKQFFDGAFPDLTGIVNRANPQANATEALVTTIDVSGGGTEELRKPSATTSAYADWQSVALTVVGGQKYITFFDVEAELYDTRTAFSLDIIEDGTFRSLINFTLSNAESTTAPNTGLMRVSFAYEIPPSVTSIRIFITVNMAAGGTAGGTHKIRIANCGNIRTA